MTMGYQAPRVNGKQVFEYLSKQQARLSKATAVMGGEIAAHVNITVSNTWWIELTFHILGMFDKSEFTGSFISST